MTQSRPRRAVLAAILITASALGACTLAPAYQRPALPVGQAWPASALVPAASQNAPSETAVDGDQAWRQVFLDPRLQGVIELALAQNRDLRVAVANIAKARAQYGVQRANLLPTVDASGEQSLARTPPALSGTSYSVKSDTYTASVGFTGYELDLFGRVRSLNQAALQSYLATEQDLRTARISLIAEVAADYLTLAADGDQLALTQSTLKSREASEALIQREFELGTASQLDLRQAQTLTEQARSDQAAAIAAQAQALNALRLVVGAEIPTDLSPAQGLDGVRLSQALSPGLPADVLRRRPDVLSAEHTLKADNADIGAARAAFFPKITLTGSAGTASTSLGQLFAPGTGAWSFTPQISLPIFAGGANIANLKLSQATRDAAVATYEKAIQTAFREVADALAVKATIGDQVAAETRLVAAATDSERLSRARFERGVDSYLTLLDAQRTLYGAQQTLISDRLTEASNRITLYKVLGGGGA